eukprot:206968-Prorocentrum_minimum.AAC.1
MALTANLEERAGRGAYKGAPALAAVFLMNNVHHLAKCVHRIPGLPPLLGEEWAQGHRQIGGQTTQGASDSQTLPQYMLKDKILDRRKLRSNRLDPLPPLTVTLLELFASTVWQGTPACRYREPPPYSQPPPLQSTDDAPCGDGKRQTRFPVLSLHPYQPLASGL